MNIHIWMRSRSIKFHWLHCMLVCWIRVNTLINVIQTHKWHSQRRLLICLYVVHKMNVCVNQNFIFYFSRFILFDNIDWSCHTAYSTGVFYFYLNDYNVHVVLFFLWNWRWKYIWQTYFDRFYWIFMQISKNNSIWKYK